MKYSLADYTLSITVPSALKNSIGDFKIGGKDNATDSVSIEINEDQWTTESFATGAYVHNKSYARTGKVTVSISQLSEAVTKLKNFANVMYGGDYDGAEISLSQSAANSKKSGNVVTATDCYVTKIPAQEFGENAGKQSWTFTCGIISFE